MGPPNLDGLPALMLVGFISFVGLLGFGAYSAMDAIFLDEVYETHQRIVPETKLVTDGTKVDTIFIYRFE